jgi:hypothetical protein
MWFDLIPFPIPNKELKIFCLQKSNLMPCGRYATVKYYTVLMYGVDFCAP